MSDDLVIEDEPAKVERPRVVGVCTRCHGNAWLHAPCNACGSEESIPEASPRGRAIRRSYAEVKLDTTVDSYRLCTRCLAISTPRTKKNGVGEAFGWFLVLAGLAGLGLDFAGIAHARALEVASVANIVLGGFLVALVGSLAYSVCRNCGAREVVPTDSKRAAKLLRE